MNVNELIDVYDKIYYITDEDREKYPILKDLSMIYKPFDDEKDMLPITEIFDYVNTCDVLGYTDWRLPFVMGKESGLIAWDEVKKYRWIDNNFRPCMSKPFVKEMSELSAIIDLNKNNSLIINDTVDYLANNFLDNGYFYTADGYTGLCSYESSNKIVDFVLVR